MQYKTELHCHTKEGSGCSSEDGAGTVEKYIKYGYSTVVVTNHFAPGHMGSRPYDTFVDDFFNAADVAKAAANGRINIITGLELKLRANYNEYLVFGATKELMLKIPDIFDKYAQEVHSFFSENGCIMIQAHPFRYDMVVTPPSSVDGYEVFNGHKYQFSHNDIALAWGNRFSYTGMILTSGSDHHDIENIPTGGIITEFEVKTNKDLIDTLRSGKFDLITTPLDQEPEFRD